VKDSPGVLVVAAAISVVETVVRLPALLEKTTPALFVETTTALEGVVFATTIDETELPDFTLLAEVLLLVGEDEGGTTGVVVVLEARLATFKSFVARGGFTL